MTNGDNNRKPCICWDSEAYPIPHKCKGIMTFIPHLRVNWSHWIVTGGWLCDVDRGHKSPQNPPEPSEALQTFHGLRYHYPR